MRDLGSRSLLVIGGSSYAITLPKDWVRERGVSSKTKVRLLEGPSGELIVSLYSDERSSRARIDLKGKRVKDGAWEIVAAYLDGYDEVEVIRERMVREDIDTLRSTLSKLLGMEVIEEESGRVLARCLIDYSSANPIDLLSRMKGIISGMLSDLRRASLEGDEETLSLVAERDDDVDRLYFALVRQVRKAMRNPEIMGKLGLEPIELLDMRIAAMILELIADSLAELTRCEHLDTFADILERAYDLFSSAFRSFELRDFRTALEIREAVERSVSDITSELSGKLIVPLINLLVRIGDLCDLVGPRF
ncbi:MAG: phosphate uptake regulator PhoU [Candidatus Korarchaeum sp.]|nr:phosphate uptake regulator PhoU [Candidatus Korarchaeum sp.]MDW8035197.1 phosphate uptake regulator PhoU [Candidatus Korarchaeum sp.]